MDSIYEKYKNEVSKKVFTSITKDLAKFWNITLEEPKKEKVDYTYQNLVKQIDKFTYTRKGVIKDLADNTKKSYYHKLKILNEMVDGNIIEKIVKNENVPSIVKKIKDMYPNTYNDYIVVLKKIIDNVDGLKELVDVNNYNLLKSTMIEGLENKQKRTDKKVEEQSVKIDWENYIKLVMKFTEDDKEPSTIKEKKTKLIYKILFNMYIYVPMRDDLGNVLLREDRTDKKINYYSMNRKRLYLNKYKTADEYGEKVYDIPSYLNTLIKKSYDSGNKYLIGSFDAKGNESLYSNGLLSDMFIRGSQKYLGVRLSINDLRHSIVSYFNKNKTIKERRELANKMGHSYSTANEIYMRVNEKGKLVKNELPASYVLQNDRETLKGTRKEEKLKKEVIEEQKKSVRATLKAREELKKRLNS